MATPLATAFVRIRPDTSGFGRELQGDLNKSGASAAKAGQKQGGLFKSGFSKALAVGGGLAAAGALFQFGKTSVKAFGEAEQAQTRLQDAFKRFPKLSDINVGALRDLNTALAQKTRFDDDAIASGQAVIAQFGLTGKQVAAVTPLIADYAAKTGKDFPTAAKLLGKASLGNTRALKDLGVNYKSTGDQSKDMANITDILRKKVGGFAEKEGKTAAGQAKILGNQFGEIQEDVGQKLVPALKTLAGVLLDVIGFVQRNSKVIGPLVAAVGGLALGIFAVNVATKAWTAATKAWAVVTKVATAVQKAFNLMLLANPLGLVIAALIALGIGLVVAYKKSETFRRIVDGTFRAVWKIIKAVWDWTKRNWPLLLGILTGPIGLATVLIIKNWKKIKDGLTSLVTAIRTFFQQLPGKISHWIGSVGTLLYNRGKSLVTGFWNGIKAVWSNVIDWFKGLPTKILHALGMSPPPKWATEGGRKIMLALLKGIIPGGKDILTYAKGIVSGLSATLGGAQIRFGGGGGAIKGSPMEIAQKMVPEWATGAQWRAWYDLWQNESGWNPLADNPTSTAFGIPQFIKSTAQAYGVYGSTDPARQIAAGAQYISDRYGDPIHAWAHWTRFHSYDKGGWLMPGATLAINKTGRPERISPPGAGGNSYHITVNVPPNANQPEIGRQIVTTIKAYERGSGTGWRK